MSRPALYIQHEEIFDVVELKDNKVIHKLINVLRLREGERLLVRDGIGSEYIYSIKLLSRKRCLLAKEAISRSSICPSKPIALAFPVLKEQKIDFILQKATELGAFSFIPFLCQHSLFTKPTRNKIERWNVIVTEAFRQSQRLWRPSISGVLDFDEIVKTKYSFKIAAFFNGQGIEEILREEVTDILLIVGPEGDFSLSEYETLKQNGFKFLKLSNNVLRVETASVFAVGLVGYFIREKPTKE